jgi:iron complex outermembrane receptor protein
MYFGSRRPLPLALLGLLFCSLLAAFSARAQGPASITGTVVDADDGQPLIGANVVLRRTATSAVVGGATTDPNGTFQIDRVTPGRYVVEARFIGYKERQRTILVEAGEPRDLTIELEIESESLETLVVTASRKREKILDAPASISVLELDQIRREATTSSVEALRSAVGVDMAQTGVDRREVALRGFNQAFATKTYVLTDYRESSVPSLGVNAYSIMPALPIDLSRVEVVRGPGSALYGPGVDSGVIHFFTKDPFQYPGTAVSVAGGSRSFFNVQARQAGVIGDNVGYKVTAQFSRANEWELNPQNPQDSTEIDRYRVYQNPDAPALDGRNFAIGDFDGDGDDEAQLRRQDDYFKYNFNGLLKYRFGGPTTLTLNGGFSALKSVFQSGVGTIQIDGFGYSYGQLRFESGDLFAQVYLNRNHGAGDNRTYVYGTGRPVENRGLQWNGQVQYNFSLDPIDTQVTTGGDVDLTRPRTSGTTNGRNEGRDDINEYGAYVQSSTDLLGPLTLTLAGRADYNNVVEEVQLSPRAAIVYSITSNHSVRGSYNQAFASPGLNSLFLDVTSQRRSLGNDRSLVFQARGAADGFSFTEFEDDRTVRFSLPVDPFFKSTYPVDALPILPMYGAVADQSLESSNGQVAFSSEVASQLPNLSASQRALLAQLFGYMAQDGNIQRFFDPGQSGNRTDAAELGIPDNSPDGFRTVNGPSPIDALDPTTTETFEVGYKGTIADRIRLRVDGYYERKEDFVGPLRVESPLAYLQGADLTNDVDSRLETIFTTTTDATVQGLISNLDNSGLPPEQVAQLLGGIVGSGLSNTPTAVVQPDQEVLPGGGGSDEVGAFLSYRNFGQVQYWGLDASLEVDVTDKATVFGNVSYVSDDFFDNEELDESDTSLNLALNAPAFKTKGGFDYGLPAGFSVGATVHYVDGFPVRSGPYTGEVESYTLLDVRAAYNVPALPGLSSRSPARTSSTTGTGSSWGPRRWAGC